MGLLLLLGWWWGGGGFVVVVGLVVVVGWWWVGDGFVVVVVVEGVVVGLLLLVGWWWVCWWWLVLGYFLTCVFQIPPLSNISILGCTGTWEKHGAFAFDRPSEISKSGEKIVECPIRFGLDEMQHVRLLPVERPRTKKEKHG